MHQKNIVHSGKDLEEAKKVLIMLHGRGASAEDILSLSTYLKVEEFAVLAPQATNYTWYPYSFLAPVQQNEPWLSSAIDLLSHTVKELNERGFTNDKIYFAGFSQGACLTLEFITRYAQRWGGAVAFTGGLIGDVIQPDRYTGSFDGTPVLIASGDHDPHVPVRRVNDSATMLEKLGAAVKLKVYAGMPHTITEEEIQEANNHVFT